MAVGGRPRERGGSGRQEREREGEGGTTHTASSPEASVYKQVTFESLFLPCSHVMHIPKQERGKRSTLWNLDPPPFPSTQPTDAPSNDDVATACPSTHTSISPTHLITHEGALLMLLLGVRRMTASMVVFCGALVGYAPLSLLPHPSKHSSLFSLSYGSSRPRSGGGRGAGKNRATCACGIEGRGIGEEGVSVVVRFADCGGRRAFLQPARQASRASRALLLSRLVPYSKASASHAGPVLHAQHTQYRAQARSACVCQALVGSQSPKLNNGPPLIPSTCLPAPLPAFCFVRIAILCLSRLRALLAP